MTISGRADDYQREAIRIDGHGLVSACPGAGKTRVLAMRSARLLRDNAKGNLVAVTFTRDAAQSLRSRILDEAGNQYTRRLAAGTFHALALNQFKRQRGGKSLRLLSAREQHILVSKAFAISKEEANFYFDHVNEGVAALEAIKASMAEPPSPRYSAAGALYAIYQRLLDRAGACDFADLMIRSVRDMAAGDLKPIPARWMLVDEAQDMDDVQYAWIAEHAKASTQIMCVADDDQSIYQWRHALGYAGLLRFKEEHDARHVTLPINYRCRPEILHPATTLIERNTDRVAKNIQPARPPGGQVYVLANGSRWHETTRIINRLTDDNPGEWAILARTNRLLDAVELGLASADIPYTRIGGKSFWEKPAAQAYLGLLKSVSDDDPIALMTTLHWAGLFRQDTIESRDGETAAEMLQRLSTPADGQSPGLSHRRTQALKLLHEDWIRAAGRGRPGVAIWGIAQWLGACADEKQAQIFTWCAEAFTRLPGTLSSRAAILTLGNKQKKQKAGRVSLMTLHAAKGLEFPCVWVVGCEDGVCPHIDSELDEERRLFYVAMTRAEDTLVLSFARDEGDPSRFIEEADLTQLTANFLPEDETAAHG